MSKNYWLMKSEPNAFSIDDLREMPKQTEHWDGVRNYQARNFMRDEMRIGDLVLFYHSNTKPPGVVGLAKVASEPYPDPTQFDPESKYFDPKSDPENPRWQMVDVAFVERFDETITLKQIQSQAEALEGCALVRRGNRLSVMPIEAEHYQTIVQLRSTS